MSDQKKQKRKLLNAVLGMIRKTAVQNAGLPSLRGTFEKEVPYELRKK